MRYSVPTMGFLREMEYRSGTNLVGEDGSG